MTTTSMERLSKPGAEKVSLRDPGAVSSAYPPCASAMACTPASSPISAPATGRPFPAPTTPRARPRLAVSRLHDGALDHTGRRAWPFQALLPDHEMIDVADPHRRGLAVDLGRREAELPDGLHRRGLEVRRDRLLDQHIACRRAMADGASASDGRGLTTGAT